MALSRRQVAFALRGEAVKIVLDYLEQDIGSGANSLAIVGEDARDVVRACVSGIQHHEVSCMEAAFSSPPSQLWATEAKVIVLSDLHLLDEETDRNWMTAAAAMLDTSPGRGEKVLGIASTLSSVPAQLLASGRLEKVVDVVGPPNMERRVQALKAMNAVQVDRVAELTPGYNIGDFCRLIHLHGDLLEEGVDRALPPPRSLGFAVSKRSTWKAVGGYQSQKTAVQRLCEWPVTHEATFQALGVPTTSGLLLHGPSGCGKSLLVSALAGTVRNVNFLEVKATEIFSKYFGETERTIRGIFQRARAVRPCIVFIDEIDALCRRRDSDEGADLERRVVGTLLAELDGISGAGRVFLLACTNRIDLVDPALLRPGRIDQMVHVPAPDLTDRIAVLAAHDTKQLVGTDVVRRVAELSEGCSCSTLEAITKQSILNALREDSDLRPPLELAYVNAALAANGLPQLRP